MYKTKLFHGGRVWAAPLQTSCSWWLWSNVCCYFIQSLEWNAVLMSWWTQHDITKADDWDDSCHLTKFNDKFSEFGKLHNKILGFCMVLLCVWHLCRDKDCNVSATVCHFQKKYSVTVLDQHVRKPIIELFYFVVGVYQFSKSTLRYRHLCFVLFFLFCVLWNQGQWNIKNTDVCNIIN